MAKQLSPQGEQTVELISWLKENGGAGGFEVTLSPTNARLIVGRVRGSQIGTLTLATPDGHAGMFNIQAIAAARPRAGS